MSGEKPIERTPAEWLAMVLEDMRACMVTAQKHPVDFAPWLYLPMGPTLPRLEAWAQAIEQAVAKLRQDALEEAARACERYRDFRGDVCAEAIRGLKTKEKTDG